MSTKGDPGFTFSLPGEGRLASLPHRQLRRWVAVRFYWNGRSSTCCWSIYCQSSRKETAPVILFTEANVILSDAETSTRLQRVPKHVKDTYGEEYFSSYIHSLSATLNKGQLEDASTPLLSDSQASTLTSGYSTLSDKSESSLKKRAPEKKVAAGLPQEPKKQRSFSSPPSSATSTLKGQGSPSLSNTNRVLHALMEAVTSSSPKVRYFVGSFQDRMVKSFSSVLPTVVMDTYLTSGDVAKVVPKVIKEKVE